MMRQNKSTERRKEMLAQKARERSARKRAQPLMRKLAAARRDGDLTRVSQIRKQLEQMGIKKKQPGKLKKLTPMKPYRKKKKK